MIAGTFHKGSGLGDQLMRYITVRTLALDKGCEWGMVGFDNFKAKSFMNIERGKVGFRSPVKTWNEREIRENGIDVRSYDPEINFVEGNTLIDGCFEDEKYWGHRLDEIREWLKVEVIPMPQDVCVIGFRGGEYYTDPNLGLPKAYYDYAISYMQLKYPGITFEVHTDDPKLAKQFFPEYECIHDISINWRSVRFAKHLIIANSAFYIMPSLLNQAVKEVIAPRYWARRNLGIWARPSSYYKDKRWMYV